MLGVRNCNLLVNDFLGDLLNVDVILGKFDCKLATQIIALLQNSLLGFFHCLSTLQHLILVSHQTFKVLSRQQDKVVVVGAHLLAADALLPGKEVQKLVSLLA